MNGMFGRFYGASTRPPHSIDTVVERVHVVAGNIHELTHVAENNGKAIAAKGEQVVNNFNVHFSDVSKNVEELITVSHDKFAGLPLGVFYTALICALILILLAMAFLIVFALQKLTNKSYDQLDESPRQSVVV